MTKEEILREAEAELERHIWGTFVDGNMVDRTRWNRCSRLRLRSLPQAIRNQQSVLATPCR
jgi:hypothetical protein